MQIKFFIVEQQIHLTYKFIEPFIQLVYNHVKIEKSSLIFFNIFHSSSIKSLI